MQSMKLWLQPSLQRYVVCHLHKPGTDSALVPSSHGIVASLTGALGPCHYAAKVAESTQNDARRVGERYASRCFRCKAGTKDDVLVSKASLSVYLF